MDLVTAFVLLATRHRSRSLANGHMTCICYASLHWPAVADGARYRPDRGTARMSLFTSRTATKGM